MNPKVYLSPIEEGHLVHYMRLSDDPELIEAMGWRPFEVGEKDRLLSAVEILTLPYRGEGRPVTFSIMTTEGDFPIGYVTLKGVDHEEARAELGIAIMDGRYRSGGYGSDALALIAEYAFQNLQLSSIGLTVFPANARAIGAYKNIGFRILDTLEGAWTLPNGEKADMLFMQLSKDDRMAAMT
jgi:RimJ/RimL family protein N-acetyltransferase